MAADLDSFGGCPVLRLRTRRLAKPVPAPEHCPVQRVHLQVSRGPLVALAVPVPEEAAVYLDHRKLAAGEDLVRRPA